MKTGGFRHDGSSKKIFLGSQYFPSFLQASKAMPLKSKWTNQVNATKSQYEQNQNTKLETKKTNEN